MHVVEIWLEGIANPFRLEFRDDFAARLATQRISAFETVTDHFGQTLIIARNTRVVALRTYGPQQEIPAVKKVSNHLPKAKPVSKAKADEPMGGKMKKMTPMKGDKAGKGKPF